MSFNIVNGNKISLKKIMDEIHSGSSVIRSSHLGNFDIITTFLSTLGIPILLHEYLSEDVKLYKPMCIVKNNDIKFISQTSDDRLAIFNKSTMGPWTTLSDHYKLTKQLLDNVMLLSHFLLSQKIILKHILVNIANRYPSIFNLYVNNLGKKFFFDGYIGSKSQSILIYKSYDGQKVVIEKKDIPNIVLKFLQNTKKTIEDTKRVNLSGFVLNTELNILLVTIVDILNKNNIESTIDVFHLSGLKMFNYMTKSDGTINYLMQDKLNFLYNISKQNIIGLPNNINFIIIPTLPLANFLHIRNIGSGEFISAKNKDLFLDNICTQYDLDSWEINFNWDNYEHY